MDSVELFDSHCHIQSAGIQSGERATRERWEKAHAQPEDIIRRACAAGVTRLLCVGCDLEDSRLAVSFAHEHDSIWASIGIHPHEAQRYAADSLARAAFKKLADAPKVVAVGECGLDYFYEHSPKDAQIALLKFQIELAIERNLPLVFHVREAFTDFWPIFESYHALQRPLRGVLHSFTDSRQNLERAIGHGLYIGVNGIATFTKDVAQQEMYKTVPLKHLLLETDAPFLTPYPDRGKICEPYHVLTTAEFLAVQRNESVGVIAEVTTQNARKLFSV